MTKTKGRTGYIEKKKRKTT